jgi:uncharacterized protein
VATDLFTIPIVDTILLYAPSQALSALINLQALNHLKNITVADELPPTLRPLAPIFDTPYAIPTPLPNAPLIPAYLGIIPTRGCNIGCRYCDFAAPKHISPVMSLEMAQQAVDAYLALLKQSSCTTGQIHFFGGEPFYAPVFVQDVVDYARSRAIAGGIRLRFEATTNGVFGDTLCRWIGQNFDAIILSLDGLPQDHDRHRPALNGRGTFDVVAKNARILSDSPCELIIRACVTGESITRLPNFAEWIGDNLKPSIVCFETLSVSPLAIDAGFTAPNPHDFAVYFDRASMILAQYDIQTVTSSADLSEIRTSFCPVSKDALIVSPDGAVDACYLLESDWQQKGLDMRLGWLHDGDFEIDSLSLQRVRAMQVQNRPLCADCLCKFHCAGGCHVHHDTNRPAGQFDNWCVQTRLITITRLLRDLGENDLADAFLNTPSAWQSAVWQASDRMILME